MIIMMNEELAEKIFTDLKDYGKEFDVLDSEKRENILIELSNQAKNGLISIDDVMVKFDEYKNKINAKQKEIEENIKPTTEKIKEILKGFTQEMLCCLLSKSNNKYLNKLITDRIKQNNFDINFFNTIEYESGRIFETLTAMSDEDVKRLLAIRESEDSIDFNGNILVTLDDKVKNIIFSRLNKENVDEEKEEYCKEKGIKDEVEFQIRKMGIINSDINNLAQDVQRTVNEYLGIDDDSLVKFGESQMSGIRFKI